MENPIHARCSSACVSDWSTTDWFEIQWLFNLFMERLEAMDARFKAEKQRHSLVLQRAETSANINVDLRKEYETQLALFKELREKYDQRVQVLTAENERLKEALKGGPSG
ncbi:hypothetical protein EVAR_83962_1 [Eumeta japonica]|uniref:Uncharacterized protein n=1 Tax=Eumeta variegata TaxID=151549 RepID=A0A4C1VPD6_EUMVA|nr:hypothetical protein EVAR_83962_1 [Eumeta japonica]